MRFGKEHLRLHFLWLMIAGCVPAMPEFKGTLRPGQELVTIATRQGISVRVLLMTPDTRPIGDNRVLPRSELGKRPIIASLSLGEERTFIMKHKREKALKPVRLRLTSGCLLC